MGGVVVINSKLYVMCLRILIIGGLLSILIGNNIIYLLRVRFIYIFFYIL